MRPSASGWRPRCSQWGLRLSQRTTRSEQQIKRQGAASPQRRGILIGVWDESDVPDGAVEPVSGRGREQLNLADGSAAGRNAAASGDECRHARKHSAQGEVENAHDKQGVLHALSARVDRMLPWPAASSPSRAQAQIGGEPIRIIFPFAAGGSGDALARLIAEHMRTALDQPVIVENRTGAQGRIGVQAVKAAAPDGKTILLTPVAPMSIYQHVYKSLAYDPIADFEPISQVATFDFAIAVGPQVPAKIAQGAGRLGEGQPGQGSYGTPAAGTLPHFFAVSFGKAAGLDLRHVGYRGSAAALTDLVGGADPDRRHHHQRSARAAQGRPHPRAGHLRQARSPFLPDMPTFKEAGYDIEGTGWYGVFAPAKTPPDMVERLNKAHRGRGADAAGEGAAAGLRAGADRHLAAELAQIQKADSELWAPAVKASGFTPEQ